MYLNVPSTLLILIRPIYLKYSSTLLIRPMHPYLNFLYAPCTLMCALLLYAVIHFHKCIYPHTPHIHDIPHIITSYTILYLLYTPNILMYALIHCYTFLGKKSPVRGFVLPSSGTRCWHHTLGDYVSANTTERKPQHPTVLHCQR